MQVSGWFYWPSQEKLTARKKDLQRLEGDGRVRESARSEGSGPMTSKPFYDNLVKRKDCEGLRALQTEHGFQRLVFRRCPSVKGHLHLGATPQLSKSSKEHITQGRISVVVYAGLAQLEEGNGFKFRKVRVQIPYPVLSHRSLTSGAINSKRGTVKNTR